MTEQEIEARLARLLREHPGAIANLYALYGIEKLPDTPEDLLIAYHAHGDLFVKALSNLIARQQSAFTGEEAATEENKWLNIFSTGLQIITTGAETVNAFKSKADTSSPEKPSTDILGMPRSLFIGMAVVLSLLIIFIIINSLKK